MDFDLNDAISLLERTPKTLEALLSVLPEGWESATEGGESWSARDVLGHLVYGEKTDWIPRAWIIMEHGESRPFEPFDHEHQMDESKDKSLAELLTEFTALRQKNLDALRAMNLQPADFTRKGRHPALGTVTLGQLIATWAVHDLDHLRQASRTLARQYTTEVGPWRAYLGILNE